MPPYYSRKYSFLGELRPYEINCHGHLFIFVDSVLQNYRRGMTYRLLFDSFLMPCLFQEENVSAIFFNTLFKMALKVNGKNMAQLQQLFDAKHHCIIPRALQLFPQTRMSKDKDIHWLSWYLCMTSLIKMGQNFLKF